jgi:hypothetical protein
MKKMFAVVLVTLLASFGLVATTTGPATAACPYTACINTASDATGNTNLTAGRKAKIKVTVAAPNSNVPVSGTVSITVERKKGGFEKTYTKSYTGSKLKLNTGKLGQPGRYKVTVIFTPPANSVFNPSTTSYGFKVANKRR